MFSIKTDTTAAKLLTAVAVACLIATAAVAPVAAQQAPEVPQNATKVVEQGEEENTLIYQFEGGGTLVDVNYRDGSTFVTLAATEGDQLFGVSEGDVQTTGSFEFEQVRVDDGETATVELPVSQASVVVTTTQDGYYYAGGGGIPVITDEPTNGLVQIGSISGISGGIFALLISAGQLRRKHNNSYRELFSDERKKVDEDNWTGYRERAVAWVKSRRDSKISTGAGILFGVYVLLVVADQSPAPGEIWMLMSDTQRLFVAGSAAAAALSYPAMYTLAKRLYSPDKEYILDLDARDVYKAASGDKSGQVRAYSGPPSRIVDMDVDGAATTISTPGGRAHLVRGFDTETNTAEGGLPELADDREASIEVQKIDHNREILTDLATIGRDLIGAMTAFRVTADSAAMRDIDEGLRNTVSAGQDSMEDVLSEAVAGTKYEGTYKPNEIDDVSEFGTEETASEDANSTPTPEAGKTESATADAATDGGRDE